LLAVMPLLRRPAIRAAVALVVLFCGLFVYAGHAPLGPRLVDPARVKVEELDRLRASLRDPESARFRGEFVAGRRPLQVVCGRVNLKDDAGAYVGYQRFITGATFRVLERSVDGGTMDELWGTLCARR
jgi:hypothetical protein